MSAVYSSYAAAQNAADEEKRMSKTKHLDNMLETFAVKPGHKRAKRKADVELELYIDKKAGTYTIISNNRILVERLIADSDPHLAVKARAASIKAMGKTVNINTYED